jgi:hypothetical protein
MDNDDHSAQQRCDVFLLASTPFVREIEESEKDSVGKPVLASVPDADARRPPTRVR